VWEGPSEIIVPYLDLDQEFSFAMMLERCHPLFEALFFGAVNRLLSAKSVLDSFEKTSWHADLV
jgi:hypothetical protein